MDKNQITEEFIERMVDKIVSEIKRKLDELDISLDFIAAALLGTDAISIGSAQDSMGRAASLGNRTKQTKIPDSE